MKKFEGTISIIIPVYQAEKYLYRCLDSILTQSYSRLEVILIDDGSRDRSPQICDEYAKKDSRVKVIHKKNGGAASARNSGIDVATGEYIGFVDSDDWIEKDTYKKIVQVIEQHEPELLLWDYNKINVGNSYQVTQPIREGMYTKEQMYKEYFDHLLMFKEIEFPPTISNWVCLVKRSLLEKNNIRYNPDIKYCEDSLFGSQCAYFANSFYYMKKQFLYNYEWNPNSTTKTYHEDKWEIFQKLIHETESFFGSVSDFDFSEQLQTQVVYLALNTIGEIIRGENEFCIAHRAIQKVLWSKEVRKAFKSYRIPEISRKLKVVLKLYEFKLSMLVLLIGRRKKI